MLDALQDGHKAVVVGRWDGVELVVVAARAGEGRAQEGGRRGADDVVQLVGPLVGGEDGVRRFHLIEGARDEEASRGVGTELVTGKLLADELIVG